MVQNDLGLMQSQMHKSFKREVVAFLARTLTDAKNPNAQARTGSLPVKTTNGGAEAVDFGTVSLRDGRT